MTHQDGPSSADPSDRAADTLERLLRLAGPRRVGDAERARRVHDAVHDAWRDSIESRSRAGRRGLTLGAVVLAAAAAVVIAVFLPQRKSPIVPPPPPRSAARLVAATDVIASLDDPRSAVRVGDEAMVGSAVETGGGVLATFAFAGGGEIRLNEATTVRFTGPREVHVDRGAIYFDSGSRSGSFTVNTPVGVVRDVGTRFEVALRDGSWRVRVRDGLVQYDGTTRHEASAGRELIVEPSGSVVERTASIYGADWDWVTRAAPAFQVEGKRLAAFLEWVARESGRRVEFSSDELRRTSAATILHGSIEHLTPDEALDVILPTCGLSSRIDSQRVVVSASEIPAGGLR